MQLGLGSCASQMTNMFLITQSHPMCHRDRAPKMASPVFVPNQETT